MPKKALVKFVSGGSTLIVPFESFHTVSEFIQAIADLKHAEKDKLNIIFQGKQYRGNTSNNQTLESIGMDDRVQITVTMILKETCNMPKNASVTFGSDGSNLIIPFKSFHTVSEFIQAIADLKHVEKDKLNIIFQGKQYRGNTSNNQTLESIGMDDRAQITVTTRFKGGL